MKVIDTIAALDDIVTICNSHNIGEIAIDVSISPDLVVDMSENAEPRWTLMSKEESIDRGYSSLVTGGVTIHYRT